MRKGRIGQLVPERLLEPHIGDPLELEFANTEEAALALAAAAATRKVPLCLVTKDPASRDQVEGWLRFLLSGGPVDYRPLEDLSFIEDPYENALEGRARWGERCSVLSAMALEPQPYFVCLSATAASRWVPAIHEFLDMVKFLEVRAEVDMTDFLRFLVDLHYVRRDVVDGVGTFAHRGGIVDVFSPLYDSPLRIEFFGDEVESLRHFELESQTTLRTSEWAFVVPAVLAPMGAAVIRERARRFVRVRQDRAEAVEAVVQSLTEDVIPGGSVLFPALFATNALSVEYPSDGSLVACLDPEACAMSADASLDCLERAYHESDLPVCAPPRAIAASGSELLLALRSRPLGVFCRLGRERHHLLQHPDLVRAGAKGVALEARVSALRHWFCYALEQGYRVLVLAGEGHERERSLELLTDMGLRPREALGYGLMEVALAEPGLSVGRGTCTRPFVLERLGLVVLPWTGILDGAGGRPRSRPRAAKVYAQAMDMRPGDLVVHTDHGLGRFVGLETVEVGQGRGEFLVLEYRDGDRLLVPLDKAHCVHRYLAPDAEKQRTLDRLGGQSWHRRKARARKAARNIADKLMKIYARRMAGRAHAFSPPDAELRSFESTFPFELTEDQVAAVEEVLADLMRDVPMDRLVCGDVGFGKTEVAVRAAYKVAMEGKQVAVLVPTTILAEQHRATFEQRLRDTPITVDCLSRMKSGAEAGDVLRRLRGGALDVVIGTHRLLSRDVHFKDLGLLILDEEHRFGVAQKERIREIAATVHTLSMSATPIPRTLHMALSGIRDLSVIATPPRDRKAIRTILSSFSWKTIRRAVLRELKRGGRVFFVHNRVETLPEVARNLASEVPQARIAIAHGRMQPSELEEVMTAFVAGEKDVLVCTSIVQSGLDIPTANTMIIDGADRFGLAELYQLRGRVGRSSEQAYCYFLVDSWSGLTQKARKRLAAIERYSELASGFGLASADLEIRGPGNLLGAEQSGHFQAVGFEMFMEMVARAVQELQGEEISTPPPVEVKVDLDARIPKNYVPDDLTRLRFYRRLASAQDLKEVRALLAELVDRFGRAPLQVEDLFGVAKLRVLGAGLGLRRVEIRGPQATLWMRDGESGRIWNRAPRFSFVPKTCPGQGRASTFSLVAPRDTPAREVLRRLVALFTRL